MEYTASTTRKNRLKRNSVWMIGVGTVLFAVACIATIFYSVGTMLRDSDAFHLAVSAAQASPVLLEKVGSPMETGRFISGSIEVSPATGLAELSIPVSGPRGRGKLYVEAHKSAGNWRMSLLQFVGEGTQTPIDLLPAAPDPVLAH
jgi:hypothetical protein